MVVAVALVGFAVCSWADTPPACPIVGYEQLTKLVTHAKGKVVLVDIWFDACVPCKRGLPKVWGMERKYRDAGLVTLTVNVDDTGDEQTRARVIQFLSDQKASGINVQLNERSQVWQQKLDVKYLPMVFLFDRQGQLLRKWSDGVDYAQIEKRVQAELETSQP